MKKIDLKLYNDSLSSILQKDYASIKAMDFAKWNVIKHFVDIHMKANDFNNDDTFLNTVLRDIFYYAPTSAQAKKLLSEVSPKINKRMLVNLYITSFMFSRQPKHKNTRNFWLLSQIEPSYAEFKGYKNLPDQHMIATEKLERLYAQSGVVLLERQHKEKIAQQKLILDAIELQNQNQMGY